MDLSAIKDYIDEKHTELTRKQGERNFLLNDIKELDAEISANEELQDLNLRASMLLKHCSKYAREQSVKIIETIVTSCLQFVFESKITFFIEESEDRKNPQIEFYILNSDGNFSEKMKPEESHGGGIVDVVCLALRIAISQILIRDGLLGPIILDEPAKFVSADYIGNVGLFLKNTSNQLERQIIMVTHDEYLSNIGDRNFEVGNVNGDASVTLIQMDNI